MIGARAGRWTWFRRVAARAMAGELSAFVVPGPEIALAHGLDLRSAGVVVAETPRHASVLLLVGEIPTGLGRAASVAYAQMPRPRAVLALGVADVSALPPPDVSAPLEQSGLVQGVEGVRRWLSTFAWSTEATAFDTEAVGTETRYTCPMHPEVVQDRPGKCPICGMDLVLREEAGTPHGHHDTSGRHGGTEQAESGRTEYSCPMHPEVVQDEPGTCPKCGMRLEPREGAEHAGHGPTEREGSEGGHRDGGEQGDADHGSMQHGGFMSMVMMTKDLPRSDDGLPMEWVEAPFGPLFPGLPGGLALVLTLDGDTVAEAQVRPGTTSRTLEEGWRCPADDLPDRLASLDPLSPASYRLLALRALEAAAGVVAGEERERARAGALERERAASHLDWLAQLGHLLGLRWLVERAGELQHALVTAKGASDISSARDGSAKMVGRLERTPLLEARLRGAGFLHSDRREELRGPVGRAAGRASDARCGDPVYRKLGFEPVVREGSDALSRLRVRLAEIGQSLDLALAAGSSELSPSPMPHDVSGHGSASVETPRGEATLSVHLTGGEVTHVVLTTPSERHVGLVGAVAEGREVSDALLGIASLDLSPWEVDR